MSVALSQYNKEIPSLDAAFAVCNAFLNKTQFFQRRFISSLFFFSNSSLVDVLRALNRAGLLTGEAGLANFNVVVKTHTVIMSCDVWDRIRMPDHRLTQVRFDAMIQICVENRDNVLEGQRLFIAYVNREILGLGVPQAGAVRPFNPAQSIHTASVHETVTLSAKNLNTLYGANITGIKLDKVIEEMSTWLTGALGDSLETMAAKRCFPRLTTGDFFTDPGSRVSMKQLLALAWVAIHDEEKRLGTLEDAKVLFINGLYETQRGRNISETGVDNHQPATDYPQILWITLWVL